MGLWRTSVEVDGYQQRAYWKRLQWVAAQRWAARSYLERNATKHPPGWSVQRRRRPR